MRRNLQAATVALLSLLAPLQGLAAAQDTEICSRPATAFCSAFEDGNLAAWNAVNGSPAPALVVDPGPFARPDNHVLRLYVPGAGGASVIKTFPGAQKIYADGTSGGKVAITSRPDSTAADCTPGIGGTSVAQVLGPMEPTGFRRGWSRSTRVAGRLTSDG